MGKVRPVERIEEALSDSVKEIKDRDRLLADLAKVREVGFKKFEMRNTENSEKISWARLVISSCSVSDQILRSREQDELSKRVELLEEVIAKIRRND